MSKPFLTPPWRKALIGLHLLCGVGWMGLDFGLAALAFTGRFTSDAALAAACYAALAVIVPPVLPALSLGVLATGVGLGLGTVWGLLRYWWVAVKLGLAVLMAGLVFFLLVPLVSAMPAPVTGASAEALRAGLGRLPTMLLFPPVVSFVTLGFAAALSLYKPWGRIRGD